MPAGKLRHRVRFLRAVESDDGHHGKDVAPVEIYACGAEMQFRSGGETVQGAVLRASGFIKVKIRSCVAARSLLASDVMRDREGRSYNLRAIDAVTDPAWVWIDAEFGVPKEMEVA